MTVKRSTRNFTMNNGGENMIKYNYTGAAALWDRYYDTICDPWTLGTYEKQTERRIFMHELTRGNFSEYIDYVKQEIEYILPSKEAKSRCFDFELIKQYEDLITEMRSFKGVIS